MIVVSTKHAYLNEGTTISLSRYFTSYSYANRGWTYSRNQQLQAAKPFRYLMENEGKKHVKKNMAVKSVSHKKRIGEVKRGGTGKNTKLRKTCYETIP